MQARHLFSTALIFAALGCTTPNTTPTADDDDDDSSQPPVDLGVDPAQDAPAGAAFTGQLRNDREGTIGGVASESRQGDWRIWNDRVAFVIQGLRPGHNYHQAAGGVIDADLVRPAGHPGRDGVVDIFPSFSLSRIVDVDQIEVVSSGADGGPAILRTTGVDVPWAFINGGLELDDPLVDDLDLTVVTEYRLEPDSWNLELSTTFANDSGGTRRVTPVDVFMSAVSDYFQFSGGEGLGGLRSGALESIGLAGRAGEPTLMLWSPEGTLGAAGPEEFLVRFGIAGGAHEAVELGPGESATIERVWTLAPDSLTAEAERWSRQGVALSSVSGTVRDDQGAPLAGVRVFLERDDPGEPDRTQVAGFALSDAEGRWQAQLPAGSWRAWAVARGSNEWTDGRPEAGHASVAASIGVTELSEAIWAGAEPGAAPAHPRGYPVPAALEVELTGDVTDLDFALARPGRVEVIIEDDAGAPLPGVVRFIWEGDEVDALPADLREPFGVGGASGFAFTADGRIELALPPGPWRVEVEHSWRHGRAVLPSFTLGSGDALSLPATLPEVVPRDGWLALDTHLHASPSLDGKLSMEDRLLSCAATGLELPVTSDHERQVDYRPLAQAMGLQGLLQPIPAIEVTTLLRGHWNVFPVEPAGGSNGGSHLWWDELGYSTSQLYQAVRAAGGADALVQINHGRGPGAVGLGDYEPEDGSFDPELWSWDVEMVEIVSGRLDERLRTDWMSWLNQGHRVLPTGSSDSHTRSSMCGYGRTDVFLDRASPEGLTGAELSAALRSGAVVVAGGLTLRAQLGGTHPGAELSGPEHDLALTLRAPDWIQPNRIRLWWNGVVLDEIELDDTPLAEGLWFEDSLPLDFEEDGWLVVEALGDAGMGRFRGSRRPYALSNAWFVDVAGDGWQAPGLVPSPVRAPESHDEHHPEIVDLPLPGGGAVRLPAHRHR